MHIAEIKDGKIIVEEEPEEVFQIGGYGKIEDSGLILEPEEAMNLMTRQKLEVYENGKKLDIEEFYKKICDTVEGFHEKMLVYHDLRNRGFVVRPGYSFPCDLRVYKRGTSFDKDEQKMNHVKWLLDVVRTDEDFVLKEKVCKLNEANNIRSKLALGIVDEEGDVTYYEVEEEGRLNEDNKESLGLKGEVKGFLENKTVVIWDGFEDVYEPMYFGKRREKRVELNIIEALFLVEKDILTVEKNGKSISAEDLRKIGEEKDIEFENKYKIYSDLREKGFLVKCGFKFGTHFRVYDRGVKLKRGQKSPDEHTKWVVHSVPEDLEWSYPELSRFVRLALNIRSKPTLGVTNKTKKYYRIRRIKP